MRSVPLGTVLLATLSLLLGCGEQRPPTEPSAVLMADKEKNHCRTPADVVVTDEASLQAAVLSAHPGEVIGVDGLFTINTGVGIFTEGVVLTCVTPGSGLVAAPGVINIVLAGAKHVAVDHLVLDGSQITTGGGPYIAFNNGFGAQADSVRFTNNTVTCSPAGPGQGLCVFVVGGTAAVIADNHLEAAGSQSGIHVQSNGSISSDGARVERNIIVATAPSGLDRFGAIRPFGVSNIVVAKNTILGPWSNGISARLLANSRVERNRIRGATRYGIQLGFVAPGQSLASDGVLNNVFRHNRISASGIAGVWARLACGNRFVDNNLAGNANNLGMIFTDSTGANTVVGDDGFGFVIIDTGALDCDGDGVNDPNIIRAEDDGEKSEMIVSEMSAVTRAEALRTVVRAPARTIQEIIVE